MTFTQQQRDNWAAYEKVRLRGRFNMFDPKARQLTGLGRDEYLFVMENYVALRDSINACRAPLPATPAPTEATE